MKKSSFFKMALVLAVVFVAAGAYAGKSFLTRFANSEEFKRFAERKVGEYLKAKVSIGVIRPYRFNQIALEKIIIETPSAKGGSQLIRVDRLLFRYHWSQLWNQKFDNPAGVVLKNPSILIEEGQFPYGYFGQTSGQSPGFGIPSLDFKGGEIRYRLPSIGKDVLLTRIDGKISPAADMKVQIDIQAKASGVLEGNAVVRGLVDPVNQKHDLWLELDQVNFSRDIPLPFREISGKLHWVDKDLFFEEIKASLHGWSARLSGSFENLQGKPKTTLRLKVGKENPWLRTDLVLNLSEQWINGAVRIMEQPAVNFEGKVRADGKQFVVDSLVLDNGYRSTGELDFSTGSYHLAVEKKSQRFSVFSNMRGLDLAVHFSLDHFQFLGMDLVTQGRVYLHAMSVFWEDRQFLFKGDLETDYLILDQEPFQDFKGSFDVNPYGVENIRCDWGRKFQMTGRVLFSGKNPQAKLTLRVAAFDLGDVQFFASKPLPRALGGMLDGKIRVEGDLRKPEITAELNVRDGKWGKIDYDRGIIQFRGFAPYFPMEGSKIWKGRSTFFLKGAIDLTLDNILAGVKIETPDSLIVWKGLEVALHESEGNVQLKSKHLDEQGGLSALELGTVKRSELKTGNPNEERLDETGITAGTKLKF